jgi:signal peptidase I
MTDAAHPDAESDLTLGSTPEAEPEKPTAMQEVVEIVKTVVYALLIALVLRVFLFQPFTIPSDSMEPNLLHGDYIIVSKWSYGYSKHSIPFSPGLFKGRIFNHAPKRGDIVVFKLPRDNKTDYIKRCIGLPGDRIQVRGGVLYVNEKPLPRVQVTRNDLLDMDRVRIQETSLDNKSYVTYSGVDYGEVNNTGVYLVPDGHYFMMGDNRDNSLDSRVSPQAGGVGFVPAENLVGKAQIILLSWNVDAALFKPWTWFLDARPSRFVHLLK